MPTIRAMKLMHLSSDAHCMMVYEATDGTTFNIRNAHQEKAPLVIPHPTRSGEKLFLSGTQGDYKYPRIDEIGSLLIVNRLDPMWEGLTFDVVCEIGPSEFGRLVLIRVDEATQSAQRRALNVTRRAHRDN